MAPTKAQNRRKDKYQVGVKGPKHQTTQNTKYGSGGFHSHLCDATVTLRRRISWSDARDLMLHYANTVPYLQAAKAQSAENLYFVL